MIRILVSNTLDNDSDISNGFNSIFTKSSFKPPHPETSADGFTMSSISFTLEVFQQLFKIDTSKAPGIDGISVKVLQCCAGSLTPVVHHLFNLYIDQSSLPNEWHTHLIIPIHKFGPKEDIHNYRPVSLLCILLKVLERLIYNELIPFLSTYFISTQFSFIKGRSSL